MADDTRCVQSQHESPARVRAFDQISRSCSCPLPPSVVFASFRPAGRCWLAGRTERCGCCLATPPLAGQTRPAPATHCAVRQGKTPRTGRLMRVNHVGEVCAQALYRGRASVCREPATRALLLEAAAEEVDHGLVQSAPESELGSRPSLLNPVWYAGSFALGVVASYAGEAAPGFHGRNPSGRSKPSMATCRPCRRRTSALAPDRAQDEGRRGASPRQRGKPLAACRCPRRCAAPCAPCPRS